MKITFKEVFSKFKKEKYPTLSEETIKGYETSYKKCKDLYDVKMKDIRLSHLQGIIDDSNSNYPVKSKLRVLLRQVSKYAYKNDIVKKDYSMYINIGKQNEVGERQPFTQEHRQLLWDNIDVEWVDSILILLYTGMRINELMDIEIQNVHLDEEYPYMVRRKQNRCSVNGRIIPIHRKIFPIVQKYYEENKDKKYLITNFKGEHMKYGNYRRNKWDKIMERFDLPYIPHCTRHTLVSLLRKLKVDPYIIKKIVGHTTNNDTTNIYTHVEIKDLYEAINLIDI